jgi:hypothetical protein
MQDTWEITTKDRGIGEKMPWSDLSERTGYGEWAELAPSDQEWDRYIPDQNLEVIHRRYLFTNKASEYDYEYVGGTIVQQQKYSAK